MSRVVGTSFRGFSKEGPASCRCTDTVDRFKEGWAVTHTASRTMDAPNSWLGGSPADAMLLESFGSGICNCSSSGICRGPGVNRSDGHHSRRRYRVIGFAVRGGRRRAWDCLCRSGLSPPFYSGCFTADIICSSLVASGSRARGVSGTLINGCSS